MRRAALLMRDVWRLARGYWSSGSEERWSALLLLGAVIGLNLFIVWVNVLLNQANGDVFTALQKKNSEAFFTGFGWIMVLILLYLATALLRYFLREWLQLRWRRWLTDRYLSHWLEGRAFYRMRFAGTVDNPDQRIAEDIRNFTSGTLGLGLGLLSSIVTFVSFAAILWNLSGSLEFTLLGLAVAIPGYMFWAAVVYSGIGSVLAHFVGKPLIFLNNRQQGVEADFRFGLVRLREEAEGIALYGGEAVERRGALATFGALYANYRRLIAKNTQYLAFEVLIGQLAHFFPLLVASPRYFSGAIELGDLMRVSNAFGRVNDSLSWFINNYQSFADWRATVDRLNEFGRALDEADRRKAAGARISSDGDGTVGLDEVAIALPGGAPLIAPVTLRLAPGEDVLVMGPTGSGKSTLFRVIAGLWPFGGGAVSLPRGARTLFLPQRAYMPIGTLRAALWFPEAPPDGSDDRTAAALAEVGLAALGARLDETAHWSQVLSPGEQQRVAIARALLLAPDWLFMDEATSAMDEAQEARLYAAIGKALPRTTVVSIGHRAALRAHHDRLFVLERDGAGAGRLVEAAAATG